MAEIDAAKRKTPQGSNLGPARHPGGQQEPDGLPPYDGRQKTPTELSVQGKQEVSGHGNPWLPARCSCGCVAAGDAALPVTLIPPQVTGAASAAHGAACWLSRLCAVTHSVTLGLDW
jgi:hypothetical protein